MKIGFFSNMTAAPWGASETLWFQTAQRLLARGIQVCVNHQQWPQTPQPLVALQREGATLHARGQAQKVIGNLKRSLHLGGLHRQWLQRESPNLVLISSAIHGCDLSLADDLVPRRIPYAILVHGADPQRTIKPHRQQRHRRAYRNAHANLFVSQQTEQVVRRQIASLMPYCRSAANPLQLPANFCPPWPDVADVWKIAIVGRLDIDSKAQDRLLQALAGDVWRRRPVEFHFWGAGPDLELLQRQAATLNLTSLVQFHGHTADMQSVWRNHHAMLLPSKHEGVPMVTIEALHSGRVAIVTPVGRNAEMVDDGETGFLIKSPRVADIAAALERAWKCRAQWESMGRLAATRIRQRYPADPVGDLAAELIEWAGSWRYAAG